MTIYTLKPSADGKTATVLDAHGAPLALVPDDAEIDALPEAIVVSLKGFLYDQAAASTPEAEPMTEAEYQSLLASTPAGLNVLGDPGKYARALAEARQRGTVQ